MFLHSSNLALSSSSAGETKHSLLSSPFPRTQFDGVGNSHTLCLVCSRLVVDDAELTDGERSSHDDRMLPETRCLENVVQARTFCEEHGVFGRGDFDEKDVSCKGALVVIVNVCFVGDNLGRLSLLDLLTPLWKRLTVTVSGQGSCVLREMTSPCLLLSELACTGSASSFPVTSGLSFVVRPSVPFL